MDDPETKQTKTNMVGNRPGGPHLNGIALIGYHLGALGGIMPAFPGAHPSPAPAFRAQLLAAAATIQATTGGLENVAIAGVQEATSRPRPAVKSEHAEASARQSLAPRISMIKPRMKSAVREGPLVKTEQPVGPAWRMPMAPPAPFLLAGHHQMISHPAMPGNNAKIAHGKAEKKATPPGQREEHGHEVLVEAEDEHDSNTFASYKAEGIRALFPGIRDHPDRLVESASLGSVPLPAPDVELVTPALRRDVEEGLLSDAQLESVVYASMKFNGKLLPDGERRGFFLGDGAGVGKGRQIAALIKQHWEEGGTRALWISVSQDLRVDARRDLQDMKAGVGVYSESGVPRSNFQGVLFITYSLLRVGLPSPGAMGSTVNNKSKRKAKGKRPADQGGEGQEEGQAEPDETDALIVWDPPESSRLAQVIRWLKGERKMAPAGPGRADEPAPLIIFDESHRAKNLVPDKMSTSTQTGRAVLTLQKLLPGAKVLYSSATGASEPRNLAYMSRLGMWGFQDTKKMIDLLSKSKLGALELAAMSLKATGTYLARTLSYEGAEFSLARVDLRPDFIVMYNRATMFWMLLYRVMGTVRSTKKWRGVFWSAHQRFFRSMLVAGKVPYCALLAKEAVRDGMAVIIGLQSTGEASTDYVMKQQPGRETEDLVSAPELILEKYIRSQLVGPLCNVDEGRAQALEYAIWQAVSQWKEMKPAREVVREAAAQRVAEQEALLIGSAIVGGKMYEPMPHELEKMQAAVKKEEADEGRASGAAPNQEKSHLQMRNERCDRGNGKKAQQQRASSEAVKRLTEACAEVEKLQKLLNGQNRVENFVDLTGDSDEDDEESAVPIAMGCMMCDRPIDVAMAVCNTCRGKVHAACLGFFEVPSSYICHDCKQKHSRGFEAAPLAAQNVVAIRPKVELHTLSAEELRAALQAAQQRVVEAEAELEWVEAVKLEAIDDDEPAEGEDRGGFLSAPRFGSHGERRSKAGRLRVSASRTVAGAVVTELQLAADAVAQLPGYRPSVARHGAMEEIPDDFEAGRKPENASRDLNDDLMNPSLRNIRKWLLAVVSGKLELPVNPLDDLIKLLGGRENVAELTGRRGGIELVNPEDDEDDDENSGRKVRYQHRRGDGPFRGVNLREKEAFMSGKKLIAIISEAASTGISLQADLRVENRRRRMHLTLELPWAADAAVQQFGRSHRANQASAPVYRILVSPCGGEYRFASAAAKRLQSLGALLKGDRNAVGAGSELKEFDIDTKEGGHALKSMLDSITTGVSHVVGVSFPDLPADINPQAAGEAVNLGHRYPFTAHFKRRFVDVGLLAEENSDFGKTPVSKFLNRLLGLPINEQEITFRYFADTLDATRIHLKLIGQLDVGIVSIQGRSFSISERATVHTDESSGAVVQRVTLATDSGFSFEEALSALQQTKSRLDELGVQTQHVSGFYTAGDSRATLVGRSRPKIFLVTEVVSAASLTNDRSKIMYRCRPAYGHGAATMMRNREFMDKNWTMVRSEADAKEIWDAWFNYTATGCSHGDNCRTRRLGDTCNVGARFRMRHLLCGAVLGLWERLEALHGVSGYAEKRPKRERQPDGTYRSSKTHFDIVPLMVRKAVTTNDGTPVVGIEATCKEEMDFFVNNLIHDPENPDDPLRQAHGSVYYEQAAVPGLAGGADPFRVAADRRVRGKKPKHFR